ncbi:unnamed protein product [Rotaria magnacalcarata]|uniref:Uncharacterized protein n=2 Tax=Rotaria magnacalcarata TaxID=392030 RepID=A0A816ZXR4_9BILA|nr:unnamed protein product [Rotaria magnacalcarata]CAF1380301.1 unnamed protein product [Rotaria magnacalcarata]CAF2216489.1 unnamed protein product [Rotaria magnacalcarata]CAF2224138.1 unnamed protein product [Rotaria magnacalcarata]CAF3978161.1 unnamed protein product [Rotaria magnacalcarata]
MQKTDYQTVGWLYILFCIMFILTGLTIVASSGNLLILRFVETNTKRCQHERYEMEERRRQQVCVIGDVISSNGRLVTLEDDEDTPSFFTTNAPRRITVDNSSVALSLCSCRAQPSIASCVPMACKKRFKRKQQTALINSKQSLAKFQISPTRTLRQDILDSLQRKSQIDDNSRLHRSTLLLDKIHKRSSI